jgi:hypothetical protein
MEEGMREFLSKPLFLILGAILVLVGLGIWGVTAQQAPQTQRAQQGVAQDLQTDRAAGDTPRQPGDQQPDDQQPGDQQPGANLPQVTDPPVTDQQAQEPQQAQQTQQTQQTQQPQQPQQAQQNQQQTEDQPNSGTPNVRIIGGETYVNGRKIGGQTGQEGQAVGGGPVDDDGTAQQPQTQQAQPPDQQAETIGPQELQQRQQELDQRQAELDEREQLLDTREGELDAWESELETWESQLESFADQLDAEADALDEAGMQQQEPQESLLPFEYDAPSNTYVRERPILERPAPRAPTPPLEPGEEQQGRWFFYNYW